MLGGYYLGQLYLGISGLPIAGVLSVVPSSHQLSSDQINLTQKHLLVINSSAHTLTSENITLLNTPDSTIIGVSSPEIWIAQNNILVIDNSYLGLIDDLSRIINLADYQYYTGIYIKDFSQSGDLEENGDLEAGTLILQNKNSGLLETLQIDSGVFIKTTDKQGQLN